jgi:hypothetical protein
MKKSKRERREEVETEGGRERGTGLDGGALSGMI